MTTQRNILGLKYIAKMSLKLTYNDIENQKIRSGGPLDPPFREEGRRGKGRRMRKGKGKGKEETGEKQKCF